MKDRALGLSEKIWPVAEAKARLSEILRQAEKEGPQQIGLQRTFVVTPKEEWSPARLPPMPLGESIMELMPRGTDLKIPKREGGRRPVPFLDYDVE